MTKPRPVKVWWPDFYSEAHRTPEAAMPLVTALRALDVHCGGGMTDLDGDTDFVLCGSVFRYRQVRDVLVGRPSVRLIHYNWDLYPWHLKQTTELWNPYLHELRLALDVWVPSACTADRTWEIAGRSATVMRCGVQPWEVPEHKPAWFKPEPGTYVVDVMRKYTDPNRDLVERVCSGLKIPHVEPGCQMPWDDFRWVVANAGLLVSAYYEASTGGLTLLEGYWHGVPVLLSNSPRNGGVDYFGGRASYFQWEDADDLADQIERMMSDRGTGPPLEDIRQWIDANHSEAAFASRIATRLRQLL